MYSVILILVAVVCGCTAFPSESRNVFEVKPFQPELYVEEVKFIRSIVRELADLQIEYSGVSGNANEYADKLLAKVRNFLQTNGYDPLSLGENGEIKWMKLAGLISIYRSGDTTISHQGQDIILEANLGFANLQGSAYFEHQLWWVFWISGTGYIDVKNIKISARVRVSVNLKIKATLEALTFEDWGEMHAKFDGSNWIGKIVHFFANLFPSVLTNWMKNNLPGIVFSGIKNVLNGIDFDLGQLN